MHLVQRPPSLSVAARPVQRFILAKSSPSHSSDIAFFAATQGRSLTNTRQLIKLDMGGSNG
jgi:hypothetical protein